LKKSRGLAVIFQIISCNSIIILRLFVHMNVHFSKQPKRQKAKARPYGRLVRKVSFGEERFIATPRASLIK
jgi:hypothetical protein